MSVENNRDKDLPNQSTEVVGSKPDANERILSGSRSKTGRKKRPHVDHETSDEEDSSSSSRESSSESDSSEPKAKRKRFEPCAEEAHFQWKLPAGMASYANKHLQKFVPERDLRDSILTANPVPSNIGGPKKLDEFFRELLDEQKKKTELFWDSSLEKIQQKIVNVLGPLSKVWMAIESANEAEAEKVEIPLEDISTGLEQSILLVGQSFNAVTYQRRCNVLSVLMKDHRKTKSTIKEQAKLFEVSDNEELFGKKFRKHVMDTAKVKKESKEVYRKQGFERKQPFQKGPSFQRGKGGRTAVFSKIGHDAPKFNTAATSGRGRGFHGKEKCERTSLPQHGQPGKDLKRYTRNIAHKRATKCSPRGKKNVPGSTKMGLPPGRKAAIFCKKLAGFNKQSRNLEIVSGLKIPFTGEPQQIQPPHQAKMNREQSAMIDQEIQAMLRKGAVHEVNYQKGQFLSNLFLVKKKDGGNRPVINLKQLNAFIPYQHFKMEGLHLLKEMMQEKDYMCKIDLKDAYFCLPLHPKHRKYVRFQWEGRIYEFLSLCFGLGPAPRIFTKLLKVPIALLRRLNIRIIIYLDDMLIMCQSQGELVVARETLIFLLQHLGFVINQKKSLLTPVQKIEFLGMEINSVTMTLTLPQEKVNKLLQQCQGVLENPMISLWNLSSLIGSLCSTAQAVLPSQLQVRYLQQQLISVLGKVRSYQHKITLDLDSLKEIRWWISNLRLTNGRSILAPHSRTVIQTDASKKGWGAHCLGKSVGGQWSQKESQLHINLLELKAVHLALLTFSKAQNLKSVHIQMDNMTALSYLVKMGGTHSRELTSLAKEIWDFLLSEQITITAEYLPGVLNVQADRASRHFQDSSEWLLCPQLFQKICQKFGHPDMDLFASRLFHQIPAYMAWKPDPGSQATDALQQKWSHLYPYAFPPFSLVGRVVAKVRVEKVSMILITPAWQTQPWYGQLLGMSVQNPLLLPVFPTLLKDPQGNTHPLVENNSLKLVAWRISGRTWQIKEYQRGLQDLLQLPEDQVHFLITNRPGESGLAGVVNNKLVPFSVL